MPTQQENPSVAPPLATEPSPSPLAISTEQPSSSPGSSATSSPLSAVSTVVSIENNGSTSSTTTTTAPNETTPTPAPPALPKYTSKDFKIKKKIGGGNEGTVYLAMQVNPSLENANEEYALKSVVCSTEEDITRTEEEFAFLMNLNHRNIVQHKAYWSEKVTQTFIGEQTRFYLVMEFCPDGSLEDYITSRKKEKKPFTAKEMFWYAFQICECMVYLHTRGIIHRDIKPENILLKDERRTVKVCDFGFTKTIQDRLTGTVLGTLVYMAPEIFQNKHYDESVDIWSLGVVLLQMASLKNQGEMPDVKVELLKDRDYIKKLMEGQDKKVIQLCESCLYLDAVERPTAKELISFINEGAGNVMKKSGSIIITKSLSEIPAQNMTMDLASVIHHEGARKFWETNFENRRETTWVDFKEAYRKATDFQKMSKDQERGLKILIISHRDEQNEFVTGVSFNAAVNAAGFPFDRNILAGTVNFEVLQDDEERDFRERLSEEDFLTSKKQYLDTILNHDRIFVDPISQEVLSVDQHCAPLKLVPEEEWDLLMQQEYDMDYEDDKLVRLERLGQSQQADKHENAINYLSSIPCGHRFIILGAAATGKTCMMKLLMFKAALKAREDPEFLIPVFVPIANLCSLRRDWDFPLKCIRASADAMYNKSFVYPAAIEHFLMDAIKQQKVLFLFDGLDEAANLDDKRAIQHSICQLQTDRMGIIVTSRVSGFESDEEGTALFDDYAIARIQPLTLDVQLQIAEKRGIKSPIFSDLLKGKYKELAKTPLLLSLMVQQFKESSSLPEVRAELYGKAIKTMIDIYFQKSKPTLAGEDLKHQKKELINLLIQVATYLHKNRKRDFFEDELDIPESAWLPLKHEIDSGKFALLIVLNSKYRFSHLSFQEYLVAKQWANSKVESEIRQLERPLFGLGQKILTFAADRIKKLIIDPWYRETFLLCAGAMEREDFLKFGHFLTKLYRRQGHIIDSIVYNMIYRERPAKEKEMCEALLKYLNNDNKLTIILEGLIHQSEDLRQMALGRVKLYKKYSTIAKFLIKHLGAEQPYATEQLSLVIPEGEPSTIARLLAELANKDAKIRARAAYVLGNISEQGNKEITAQLQKLLNDKETIVVQNSIEALCKIVNRGDPLTVDLLLEKLDEPKLAPTAATALGNVAEKGDVKVIEKLTKLSAEFEEAALALSKVAVKGDEQVIQTLLTILQENNLEESRINEALSHVVDRQNNKAVVDKLIQLFTGKRMVAERAAFAVGSVCDRGDKEVVERLHKMLLEKNLAVLYKVVIALGCSAERGDDTVIKSLIDILADKSIRQSKTKEEAAVALSKLAKRGDKQVLSALVQRLGDTNEIVSAAADALCVVSQDNDEVINAFKQLTKHPDPGVVEKAVSCLGKVTARGNQDVVDLLVKLLTSNSPETVKVLTAEAIGNIAAFNDEAVLKTLRQSALSNLPNIIRSACIKAIGTMSNHRNFDSIREDLFNMLSTETNPTIRQDTIAVLAKIVDVGRMIELLKEKKMKQMRPTIFTIIVKAIRLLRDSDPNWKLQQEHVNILQRMNNLESMFIFFENAG